MSKTEENKPKIAFFYPTVGVTVEAENLQQADEKLKKTAEYKALQAKQAEEEPETPPQPSNNETPTPIK